MAVAARVKKADYAFFVKPNFAVEHFFVEAKRPSAPLDTPDNCFQTIRYAYSSSRAAFSLLTHFKELYVMDCRFRPDIKTAQEQVHLKFHFTDFYNFEKFAEVYYLFGREAVANGSLERYAAALPKPKGFARQRRLFADAFQEIDEAFLTQLEDYRTDLAKMFKRNNTHLTSEDLTEAVQRTLDRIVFIRFLEDKLIEPTTILDKLLDKPKPWEQFVAVCSKFDKSYNGIIFKRHPIIDSPLFKVDDRVFRAIIDDFSGEYSPYHFNYIPIHILGSIYERFLGNVIVATAKRADVKPKPEVKKAGGVFYTPQYIVSYIVENTVGKLIEGKKPADVEEMRFADIACGSGSFLLGVYDHLLRWHVSYYNGGKNKTQKENRRREAKKDGCVVNDDGTFALSFEQKREILVKNIYGVDIDRQAHEVTQLSLFLKLLEDETQGSSKQYLTGHRESLLPSLADNIVCGNALVDWDISSGDLFGIDHEKERRLNPMSFEAKFPEVMRNGGFNAIVGNPPYLFITELSEIEKNYFSRRFGTYSYRYDIYGLFIEKVIEKKILKSPGGILGYIIPHTLLNNDSFEQLREFLLERSTLHQLVDLGPGVFATARNETMIVVLSNDLFDGLRTCYVVKSDRILSNLDKGNEILQFLYHNFPKSAFLIETDEPTLELIGKIRSNTLVLGDLCTVNQGLRTGNNDLYLSSVATMASHRRAVGGRNVARYEINSDSFVQYEPNLLDAPRNEAIFTSPEKLIVQEIRNISLARRIVAAYDDKQHYCLQSTNVINLRPDVNYSLKFLLGLLNSNLLNWFFRVNFPSNNHIASNQLAQLPIVRGEISLRVDERLHDLVVRSVEQVMIAKERLSAAMSESDIEFWTNKCDKLESDIDHAVYKLYGLTPEEIALVEGRGS